MHSPFCCYRILPPSRWYVAFAVKYVSPSQLRCFLSYFSATMPSLLRRHRYATATTQRRHHATPPPPRRRHASHKLLILTICSSLNHTISRRCMNRWSNGRSCRNVAIARVCHHHRPLDFNWKHRCCCFFTTTARHSTNPPGFY